VAALALAVVSTPSGQPKTPYGSPGDTRFAAQAASKLPLAA
jgi:hypothetical protein